MPLVPFRNKMIMIIIWYRLTVVLLQYNINVCIIYTIILYYYIRSTFLGGVKKTRKYPVLEYKQRDTHIERERITLDARIHNSILWILLFYRYLPTVRIIFYYTITDLLFFFRLKWTIPTAFIVLIYNDIIYEHWAHIIRHSSIIYMYIYYNKR